MAFTPFLHHLCKQSFKLLYSLGKRFVCYMDITIHGGFNACVTKQLLQHLGLHSPLNCAGGIGVAKCVHTKAFDACFVTELVEMGIVGTVFGRFPGS